MLWLLYFVVGFIISFIGSIPVGLITLSIMERTVHKGPKAGIMVGLGACIAELVYPFLALTFMSFFLHETQISQYIKLISVFVFAGMGIYYSLQQGKPIALKENIPGGHEYQNFGKGIILGFTNMLIIPFWILVGTVLESYGMTFSNQTLNGIFSISAMLGALLVFFLYVKLVKVLVAKLEWIGTFMNKIVGVLFLALAIIQIISLTS